MSIWTIVVLIVVWNDQTVMSVYNLSSTDAEETSTVTTLNTEFSSTMLVETSSWKETSTSDYKRTSPDAMYTFAESTITSSLPSDTSEVPLLLSIISLTVKPPRVEQQSSYSVDILINSTCSSRRESNLTLIFRATSISEIKRCPFPAKHHGHLTCDNFTYGIHYIADGYVLCGARNISLSTRNELYATIKPKYLNSTISSTSIETFFFLPGMFHRLVSQLSGTNQSCSMDFSTRLTPFYTCRFEHLPPAQWFVLTYYTLNDDDQPPTGDVAIVYTDLEDLHFWCRINEHNQQIEFYWTNLTASSNYNNLTIFLLIEQNRMSMITSCDPYLPNGICSSKQFRLEPGREYHIGARLRKILPNYNRQKNGTCRVRTDLSQIPIESIRHEFVNRTVVRFLWLDHPFDVQARLRDLERNSLKIPLENTRQMALFTNLTSASIYRLELNISQIDWATFFQTTNYHIQTDVEKPIITQILRKSDSSLIVLVAEHDSPSLYCIQLFRANSPTNCSRSNVFNQLQPASIYNLSVLNHRESYENLFFWSEQTTFKLANTNPSTLRLRTWKTSESMNSHCLVESITSFPMIYSTECISLEKSSTEIVADCTHLRCGCRYQFQISLIPPNLTSVCTTTECDLQWNNPNDTTIIFQTPLLSVGNLRLISTSLISKEIHVDYDPPMGCFDQLVLVCQVSSSKERRLVFNSTICTDLWSNELYRIYVETRRAGWETIVSNIIEAHLILTPESPKKNNGLLSIVIPCIIGLLLVLILVVFVGILFVHRRRNRSAQRDYIHSEQQTTNNLKSSTKLNHIVNQVNIYSNSKQVHPTDSDKKILRSRPIRIKDFPAEYELLIANNHFNASDEFGKLQINLLTPPALSECDHSSIKNRYKDILPYEHSRVKLVPVDECDPGYINANFISGVHKPRDYIACQAPLKTTIDDHWRMIWEQNVRILVMLTGLIERNVNKCERYWPLNLDQVEMFGEISVLVTACVDTSAYDLRYIQLKKNDEIRSLKHYAFKMWDDHTVPTQSDVLVDFIRLIRSECRPDHHGPVLVHCSAGVGRSGTFIALDRLLQQFDKLPFYGHLDVYGTVLEMRQCRDKMVQNEHQYLFIYRCLKEEYEKTAGNANYAIIADDPV